MLGLRDGVAHVGLDAGRGRGDPAPSAPQGRTRARFLVDRHRGRGARLGSLDRPAPCPAGEREDDAHPGRRRRERAPRPAGPPAGERDRARLPDGGGSRARRAPGGRLAAAGADRGAAGLLLGARPVEAFDLGRQDLETFVDDFEALFLRLFTWPAPTAAAVNGHAIAGGGILALACDRRFLVTGAASFG